MPESAYFWLILFWSLIPKHLNHTFFTVLRRIQGVCLTLNATKCEWTRQEAKYLGFRLDNGEVRPQLDKVDAICSYIQACTSSIPAYPSTLAFHKAYTTLKHTITCMCVCVCLSRLLKSSGLDHDIYRRLKGPKRFALSFYALTCTAHVYALSNGNVARYVGIWWHELHACMSVYMNWTSSVTSVCTSWSADGKYIFVMIYVWAVLPQASDSLLCHYGPHFPHGHVVSQTP